MDERRVKELCFSCDNKYNKRHKCSENKLFYIDYEEEEHQDFGTITKSRRDYSKDILSCIEWHQYSTNPQDIMIHQKEKCNNVDWFW